MGDPVLAVENYFSTTQFSGHTVSGEEEAVGYEAWHVADGRRSPLDKWKPTTANSAIWIKVDCGSGVTRTPDLIAIDRGHNLAGKTVLLQRSTDDFAADTTTVFTATIPSSVSDDTSLTAANGALTPEGAWVKGFTGAASRYWRLYINAMGADLVPELVGLWLGASWAPGHLWVPWADDDDELLLEETVVPGTGWRGGTTPVPQRLGELVIKLESESAYADAAEHIRDNYGRRRPMWIIHDDARAERAVLGIRPRGRMGFRITGDWSYRQAEIAWLEHEPKVSS